VPVGLDKNTPEAANRVYLNEDGNWRQVASSGLYPSLLGALMIRPILGENTPIDSELATSTKELLVDQVLQVFPNPANDLVHIQLFEGDYENYQISIYNALGKLMEQRSLSSTLNLTNYQTGMYFLQFQHIETRKIGYYKLVKE